MKKFSFDRFKKVVVRDFRNTYTLYGMSMLIIMLMPAAIWMFSIAFETGDVDSFFRLKLINFLVTLAASLSAMKIYRNCNISGKGNYFAMLPATLGEKFFSMLIYCFIVCPLAVFVGACAVDTLLSVLPFGHFNEYVWDYNELMEAVDSSIGFSLFQRIVIRITKIFVVASLFMMTNTIFKKNKFIKTILWLMLIGFVASIVAAPILSNVTLKEEWLHKIIGWFEDMTKEKFMNIMFWLGIVFNILLSVVFSAITYRRLKKMQY